MKTAFSNQATPKYLGYVYQVLIAIEECFNAERNQTIWIECFGDIYDGEIGTEVKHHFDKKNLTDNSVDFWKTLKNYVKEDISFFNYLVLHTTENIQNNSIFFEWNTLTKNQKYKRLKSHTPADSIKGDYNTVINECPKNELLDILDMFTLKSSQSNINEKWEELTNSRQILLIPDKYREDALHWIYGYINKQAIDDRYNWHIKINDFDSACRLALSKFTQDRISFPSFKEEEEEIKFSKFNFVTEMKNISLKEQPIENAISDYIRAQKSEIKLIKLEPITMPSVIDEYDHEILKGIKSFKNESSEELLEEDFNTEKSKSESRKLFYKSINNHHQDIPGVVDTQKYYRNGRIHHNVNECKFKWTFTEEELK